MARSKKKQAAAKAPRPVKCYAVTTKRGRIIDVRRDRTEAVWCAGVATGWQVIPGTFTPIPAAGRRKK